MTVLFKIFLFVLLSFVFLTRNGCQATPTLPRKCLHIGDNDGDNDGNYNGDDDDDDSYDDDELSGEVPINGNWGDWSSWDCSKTCGGGHKYRKRTCSNPPPSNGGCNCQGSNQQKQTATCNVQRCPAVHGNWGSWNSWSSCCGGKEKSTRVRHCTNPSPEHGGRPCDGEELQTKKCDTGQPKVPVTGRIVGGRVTRIQKWPWQVGLLQPRQSRDIFCGGSLLNQEWVLTAAHCIADFVNRAKRRACVELNSNQRLQVVLGESDLKKVEGNEIYRDVSKVCMHSKYNDVTMDYDIALLHLRTAVNYNDVMSPICMPSPPGNFPAGTSCYVTGWGKIKESGPASDKLRVAPVPIIGHEKCNEMYENRITAAMTCAGYEGGRIDSCQGDSGGPLVCLQNGTLVLAGAVSWGFGCANKGQPGVYANISYFRSWIEERLEG